MGAWVSYGLGSENQNLPAFVVLISQAKRPRIPTSRCSRACGATAFCRRNTRACSSARAATRCCISRTRRASTKAPAAACSTASPRLNQRHSHKPYGDPEIETRIAQYEMAYRMQTSVPDLMDLSKEPRQRLRNVRPRFAQARHLRRATACWPGAWPSATCASSSSIHRGWDQHNDLPRDICAAMPKASTSPPPRWSRT